MTEPDDVLRRSFVAIATSTFTDWPDLGEVDQEVSQLERWLCDPALGSRRFKRRFTELRSSPTETQVRKRLAKPGRFGPGDAVVLYVTGHGEVDDNRDHYTILAGATRDTMASTCVETKNLLKWLRQQRGLDEVMIVLDLCQAGNLQDCITPQMRQTLDGRWFVLGTSAPDEAAKLRAFADAVTETLAEIRSGKFTTEKEEYLDSEFFFRALRDRLLQTRGQALVKIIDPGRKMACLPNPLFDASSTQAAVAASRRDLALPLEDMAAHWMPRAQGVRGEEAAGWYFTGRERVMRRLVEFTSGPAGTLVVSGRAGSGKSAVLARLVTLSDPQFRSDHPGVVEHADVLPPEGAVDVAILATGKSAVQIAEQLVLALGGAPPPTGAATLKDWLDALSLNAASAKPPCVVLDALDEAADPQGVVQSLLRLVNPPDAPGLRLIVGVRSSAGEAAGHDDSRPAGEPSGLTAVIQAALAATLVFVDGEDYWDDGDLASYVERLLAREGSRYEHRPRLAAAHAELLSRGAQRSYLLAAMVAHQLSEPGATTLSPARLLRSSVAELLARDLDVALDADSRMVAFRLLRVCALAFGRGLPWRDLWPELANAVTGDGRRIDDGDVGRFLGHRVSGYLVRDLEDGVTVYRPFHDALRRALVSSPGLFVDGTHDEPPASAAHARVAEHLAQIVRQRDQGDESPPAYARRHLPEHAVAAESPDVLEEVLDERTLPWLDGDSLSRSLRLHQAPPFTQLWDLLSAWRGVRHRWSWDGPQGNKTALDAALLVSTGWVPERRAPLTGLAWRHRWGNWAWGGTVVGRDMRGVDSLAAGAVGDVPVVAVAGTSEMGQPHLQLWETSTGLAVGPALPHEHDARAIAMATVDGRPVVAALDGSSRIRLWDAATSQVREIALLISARQLAMGTVGGRTLLVAGGSDNVVVVYDVRAGTRLDDIRVDGFARALAIGEDRAGRPRLVVGLWRGPDSVVEQWDPVTGVPQGVPVDLTGEVNAVAWASGPDGDRVAAGTARGVAQVYRAENGQPVGGEVELDHHDEVRTVALGAWGHRVLLAAGGFSPHAWLVDVDSGTRTSMPHPGPVVGLAFAPADGRTMLATLCTDGNTRLWDTARSSGARRSAREPVQSLSMAAAGGRVLLAAGGTHAVTVWDAASDHPLLEDEWARHDLAPKSAPTRIAVAVGTFAAHTYLLAATGTALRLTDIDTGSTRDVPVPALSHSDPPWPPSLHVGRDGAFAAYRHDEEVVVVDAASGDDPGEVARHTVGYVDAHLLTGLGRLLVACGGQKRTRLLDARTGDKLMTVPASRYAGVSFGELGGREVLAWVASQTLTVWDPFQQSVVLEIPLTGAPGRPHLARIGDRDVAVIGHHATVRAYDLDTARVIAQFPLGTSISAVALVVDHLTGSAVIGVGGPGVMVTELYDPSWRPAP